MTAVIDRPQQPELIALPTRSAGTNEQAPRYSRNPLQRLSKLERLVGVVVLLVGWQLLYSTGVTDGSTLAGPIQVARSAWDLITHGWHTADGDLTLQGAIGTSLKRVVWGLLIGFPIGVGLAVIAGLSRLGDDLIDTPIQMLRFVPVIGLQPLIIQWFGIGEAAKISMIVIGVAFPAYVNTYHAVRGIDPKFHELARVVGLSRLAAIRRTVLPGALPGVLVGLRMSFVVSWLILVFAEQLNARGGIGYLIVQAQTFFRTDIILVGLATYAVLGLVSDLLVRGLERKALAWQPSR